MQRNVSIPKYKLCIRNCVNLFLKIMIINFFNKYLLFVDFFFEGNLWNLLICVFVLKAYVIMTQKYIIFPFWQNN